MDFSAEYISRYEEEVKFNKNALLEKEKIIKEMEEQKKMELHEKENTIRQKEQQLQEREKENRDLETELDFYRERDEKQKKRIRNIKNGCLFLWSLIWKCAVVLGIINICALIEEKTKFDSQYLFLAIDCLSIFIAIFSEIKKCKTKYFNKNE